jgi:hypothetical protein
MLNDGLAISICIVPFPGILANRLLTQDDNSLVVQTQPQ